MRLLTLTTPYMQGPDVALMQAALIKRGWLGKDHTHGQFGKATADACYRAKWHLGYQDVTHGGGGLLYDYLTGARKPTAAMVKRAHERAAAAAGDKLRAGAVAYLHSHLGDRERTGHNDCFATDWWYGRHVDGSRDWGPWCMMGASAAYAHAGSSLFRAGAYYASCSALLADVDRGRHGLAYVHDFHDLLPGDLTFWRLYPGKSYTSWERCDHIETARAPGVHVGSVLTIGCNTIPQNGNGDEANGGGVYERSRPVSLLYRVVRVGA